MAVKRIFADMDGVLVDFDRHMIETGLPANELKCLAGAYRDMKPIEGAIEAVRKLIDMGFDVWIATKAPIGVPSAYAEKVEWVMEYLPELTHQIIITTHKGMLGGPDDFLCDDRPHKASCREFEGTLLEFVDGYHWPEALEFFEGLNRGSLTA